MPLAATLTSMLADFSVTVCATLSSLVTEIFAPGATEAGTVKAKPLMVIDAASAWLLDVDPPEVIEGIDGIDELAAELGLLSFDLEPDEPHPAMRAMVAIEVAAMARRFMLTGTLTPRCRFTVDPNVSKILCRCPCEDCRYAAAREPNR